MITHQTSLNPPPLRPLRELIEVVPMEWWKVSIDPTYQQAPSKHLCVDQVYQREESVTKAKIQSYRTGATSCQRRRRVKEKRKGYRPFLIALMLETQVSKNT